MLLYGKEEEEAELPVVIRVAVAAAVVKRSRQINLHSPDWISTTTFNLFHKQLEDSLLFLFEIIVMIRRKIYWNWELSNNQESKTDQYDLAPDSCT